MEKGYIGIEDNKPPAIDKLKEAAKSYPEVTVSVVKTKYPQGDQKRLIQATTGIVVPSGASTSAVEIRVINANTAIAITDAVLHGKPLYEKLVTMTGHALKEPQNVMIRVGSKVSDVVEYIGGYASEPGKIISGGPMMGETQYTPNVATAKAMGGLLFMTQEESAPKAVSPCIRCGRCVDICPVYLQPLYLQLYTLKHRVEEAEKLHSFNDLIENNIISSREYASGKYERNGYFTIKLFAPIYAALSSDIGTPGDLMGRRMAYELLAAKGFKDGMVPYISNQYEDLAKQNGKKITIYGKERGLVTDKLVLEKLFDGKYLSWAAFKKAMYQERIAQFNHLTKVTFKDPTQSWMSNATKTIQRVNDLQQLMDEAVLQDAEERNYYYWNNYNPETDSAVHKLKKAIFKAYLDKTDDFRSSIFENKK
mgnify:CR=1 FL=1